MAKQIKIDNVLATRYDANPLTCEAIVIEWAAEHMADTEGEDRAIAEWMRTNARRQKAGKYTDIPRYGSKLWAAFRRFMDAKTQAREERAARRAA